MAHFLSLKLTPIQSLRIIAPRLVMLYGVTLFSPVMLGAQSPPSKVADDHPEKAKAGLKLFKETIKPLLQKHCLECHGGDSIKADFDLNTREALLSSGFVGENAAESYMLELIRHESEPAMPLKAPPLSDEATQAIAQWIDLGAPYDGPLVTKEDSIKKGPMEVSDKDRQFWAFKRLSPITVPNIRQQTSETTLDGDATANPIDLFIEEKLKQSNLILSPPADRHVWLRRITLDLTGIPPTPEELLSFLQDTSPDAQRSVIKRLLDSPAYGQRWARHWMDVARFAESSGFEHDYDRPHAWHYRDFLIEAFNRDLPWNQMVMWQVAGDQLEPENPMALKATGFLAAGVFPTQLTEAEFESARYDELDDVVGTIGVAFLGLSVGCARCHDHKFDPIPANDYYEIASNFSKTIRAHTSVPVDEELTRQALVAWEKEKEKLIAAQRNHESTVLEPAFQRWLAAPSDLDAITSGAWTILQPEKVLSRDGATLTQLADHTWLATGHSPQADEYTIEASLPAGTAALRLEALTHASLPRQGPGRAGNGNFALGNLTLSARQDTETLPSETTIKLVNARATHQQNEGGLSVASSLDNDPNSTGWAVDFGGIGKDQAAIFTLDAPLKEETLVTLRMRFHVNGQHSLGRFRWSASPLVSADFELGSGTSETLTRAVASLREQKLPTDPEQINALRERFFARNPIWLENTTKLNSHEALKPVPKTETILVYTEGLPPISHHADGRGYPHFYPEVHYLRRGDVHQKDGVAPPGTLQVLTPPKPQTLTASSTSLANPSNSVLADTQSPRIRFANWLCDPEHGAGHLLARVIVNRIWQHHFGRGLVATPNDFGLQGERPSHPELLDYLAMDLIANDWKLKHIHELIVSSKTYGQGALTGSKEAELHSVSIDPENRLLHRYPTRRLEGEAIRDSMLAVAGSLDQTMGGPGTLSESTRRRSVYFKIKRSQPIPLMQVFDWPEHLVSIGQRSQTTIAPQALALMNGEQVRNYAAELARRVQSETNTETAEAIHRLYTIVFCRPASRDEQALSMNFLEDQAKTYTTGTYTTGSISTEMAQQKALIDLCHALLCSNEFLHIP